MTVHFTSRSIDQDVLDMLLNCQPVGNKLPMIQVNMDRKLYTRFNDVLEAIGGKWNRSAKAHIFPDGVDVQDLLDFVIETGKIPDGNPFDHYCTPPEVAQELVNHIVNAAVKPLKTFLEPSAGSGSLVKAILDGQASSHVTAYEIDSRFKKDLEGLVSVYHEADFVQSCKHENNKFDAVAMNPPFRSKTDSNAWMEHVEKAMNSLSPGGTIGAILPNSFKFRSDRKFESFRKMVNEKLKDVSIIDLPQCSFSSSGTNVNTVMLIGNLK